MSLTDQSKEMNMHKIDKSIIKVEKIKRMFSTKEFSLGKNVNKTNFKFLVSISKKYQKITNIIISPNWSREIQLARDKFSNSGLINSSSTLIDKVEGVVGARM